MGCIYLARNLINGKGYVGKTLGDMIGRKIWHEKKAKRREGFHFQQALHKYGVANFEWRVLFQNVYPSDLDSVERAMIKLLKTKVPNGYNLTDGGEGCVGRIVSDETREKVSRAMKGKRMGIPLSVEWRANISRGQLGRKPSAETRRKISQALKGKKDTPETREKKRLGHLTFNKTPIGRAIARAKGLARIGFKNTEATRQKMRRSQQERRRRESADVIPS